MEGIGEITRNSRWVASIVEQVDEEKAAAMGGIFSELKHHGLLLLELVHSPQRSTSSLPELLQFLRRSPPDALQPFFDYALFPLLLLLDAAVDCRSPSKVDSESKSRINNIPSSPHKVGDIVAEGLLLCLEELLKKCHLGSIDQMVIILKKLTLGALLSPYDASEEFREGIIRCFKALLLRLYPCSDDFCSCKQIVGHPILLTRRDTKSLFTSSSTCNLEPEQCMIAFLQSQLASAAVGHWLSLLLKAADTEASRGHRGSTNLRVEAMVTLRVLVAKVGTPDALAFFLPGVVSQLGKVLHVSKTMISGAAGSVEATEQAIRGLAEFIMIVLSDDANSSILSIDDITCLHSEEKSSLSFLEELRHLHVKTHEQTQLVVQDSNGEEASWTVLNSGSHQKNRTDADSMSRSLHVERTRNWIQSTSAHVDKLLSATFPHLCVNPAKAVRRGLLALVQGLLSKCQYTLRESRLMLLECLCGFVCDEFEEVSAPAQDFLKHLFLSGVHWVKHDVLEIFRRLVEKLPKVVLASEESFALSHAQKLLVLIYFSGPQLVADHFLQSPVTTARFLDVLALCLNQSSIFTGSLDKLILPRPSSSQYLHSITEIQAAGRQSKLIPSPLENGQKKYEVPCIPPWFIGGSQKLYQALAGILRLVGLSLVSDTQSKGSLSVFLDIPLGYLRKLVSEVRMKEYSKESLQSWHTRNGSGQLIRQASTAVCIMNEMIFGLSDRALDVFENIFHKSCFKLGDMKEYYADCGGFYPSRLEHTVLDEPIWKACQEKGGKSQLIDCISNVLHEYLSSEIWNLPVEHASSLRQPDCGAGDITLHFFQDNAMLQQVIIDGIGVFNICLGQEFSSCGFLHLSLYVLLENLICSNFQIRNASDAVLHIISDSSGYTTVGHLVLANSDYVVDSICRQLRHLDFNPHVPNVLAALLSYIGVAHKILPLIEEPMRSVSLELEILGRHQHPDLTYPFLKALGEITKASKHEACLLPSQAELSYKQVQSKLSNVDYNKDFGMPPTISENWESILFKFNDSKSYRQTVGSIADSCIRAATPLLASTNQAACLLALNIIEDGIVALSKVEETYKQEKETTESVEQVLKLYSLNSLQDAFGTTEDGTDENRLLPAMNKIWPFLISCVRNKNPVALQRCSDVISKVVQICGGDFFSRRFLVDGSHFWKLLSTSPFQRKPMLKEERKPLQLPYRSASTASSEDSMAELSELKLQVSMLNMIANLSQNKRSAPALQAVFGKVSGIVVGIACSGVSGLRDASINALMGLASIDPDLIWLLIADVYYSLKKDFPSPPTSDFPDLLQVLPPPLSSKGYLYVQYGRQSYGFDIDCSSVDTVFRELQSKAFASQVYS